MFTDHGTYIIGFSISKQHIAVAPEQAGINHFTEDIEKAGYDYTKGIIRIKWTSPVDFSLLEKMISPLLDSYSTGEISGKISPVANIIVLFS
jgi:uncharacterized protein YdhG (YjbR/CyaY superfamily)